MYFPVSGVDVLPIIPPIVALFISSLTASAGVSGAFLLLPFQMSVLHYTSPSVSPTNLIYNIVAIPGGLYRFIKEGRMAWPLTWSVVAGTLPGVFFGAWIRIRYLPDAKTFKLFVGLVLLYLGYRLLSEVMGWNKKVKARNKLMQDKFAEQVAKLKEENSSRIAAGLPAEAVVKTKSISWKRIEYEFWGETYSFGTLSILVLSLAVGLIGGIYGIGGGAIIAPFCVAVLGLPIYTVAGAAMAGTFITSIAGVGYYYILAASGLAGGVAVTPDWKLGILFGVGGLLGTYVGARVQKFLPDKVIKVILTVLILFVSLNYISQYFIN
ncbi:sulfite exporter TauE/SafE family protein [Desulfosporosinus fructosivorans]|uniref:Probable membrane transporter protein n=1 Tax=Desulfosporosinus fructosivorans TaxID=2018669 RepID=A0A4Z0QZC4_9FIRM|nr:sulfite exporter TauE/SafE family protein [Desulfosporosinus fructosivorans]TGE36142.1 sulfite exporter TauE/SafE family protein [Desulfosporosinus fructosivorans]